MMESWSLSLTVPSAGAPAGFEEDVPQPESAKIEPKIAKRFR
jgi:hypothetical protein